MAAAVVDLLGLLKGIPVGAWVAISESQHKVLAYGVDAQAVLKEAQEKGESLPVLMRVPDPNGICIFASLTQKELVAV